jgi:hypothetical protein
MRLFQPVGGFPDKHTIGIDDAGHSHTVNADGSTAPVESLESKTHTAIPVWTLSELENLVKGGTWQEVEKSGWIVDRSREPQPSDSGAPASAPAPKPAASPDRPAEPQPQADKPATTTDGEPLVRPFPDQH